MENQLPTEFDLVVVGTGLTESIVSAAASRVGKNVLHIDTCDYYGGQWASFNLKNIDTFSPSTNSEDFDPLGEYIPIGNNIFDIKNFQTKWHILDDTKKCETTVGFPETNEKQNDIHIKTESEHAEITKDVLVSENRGKLKLSKESLLHDSRKFNIDLMPKLNFARGDFVELLISSNIARYAEFRSVSRVLTWLNEQLEIVPCSRSDVFANNKVSVVEKRMLMKLLTSLNENSESLTDEKSTSFHQFLKGKKLSENLIHYVLYAMSRSTDQTSAAEGIENTKRFLNSLGRFGKTPFLFSMYGSGETPQAFCRLSAVFGGVYALSQKSLKGIKIEDSKVKVLLNGEQQIKAENFVFGAEKAPMVFFKLDSINDYISRAIFITNKSIMPTEQEHLTLLIYPPEHGKNIVNIIEMCSLTGTCPKDIYLVHLIAKQVKNPQEDFKHIVNNLFESEMASQSIQTHTSKPNILWSCYFSLPESSTIDFNTDYPKNMNICCGPDFDLDYDFIIKKAKGIFENIYPDLEFLPRAPDPEEIIVEGDIRPEESETFSPNIA